MIGFYEKRIFSYCISLCLIILCCSSVKPLTRSDTILSYYEEGYNSNNWKTRVEAIKAVSSIKNERAENLIIKALNDSHNAVRIEALQILIQRPIKRARPIIRDIALQDSNDNVRWSALMALSQFRDPRDASVFISNCANGDWLIREAAIVGLLSIDDFSTKYVNVDVIVRALHDSSISVIMATLRNLNIRHTQIYYTLIGMLKEKNNIMPSLTIAILNALQLYRLEENDKEVVINFLTHPNSQVRLAAFHTLKRQNQMNNM
ncbi:MAG TPA: HEAT repeat domain-containing protein [Spirochaetota bacterium]|nr:HEAT repeat domain-containing protein [Spirochaetota bacterium]HOT18410.1 HEAT repeat domain-containing protein [Spirochaetota bacterium]HPD05208.1 HEAT repeat domain-containing protein [Spirochaetota bacterium]HQG42232.1 HEAT repeat domain-containing protein [Spirochaetota bacterium]